MYTIATVKVYDNHTVEVVTANSAEEARELRQKHIDALCKEFPEVDFNVVGHEFSHYATVNADHGDKATWMVIKITHHAV